MQCATRQVRGRARTCAAATRACFRRTAVWVVRVRRRRLACGDGQRVRTAGQQVVGHQLLEQVQAGLHHSAPRQDVSRKGCHFAGTLGALTRLVCTLPGCSAVHEKQRPLLPWAGLRPGKQAGSPKSTLGYALCNLGVLRLAHNVQHRLNLLLAEYLLLVHQRRVHPGRPWRPGDRGHSARQLPKCLHQRLGVRNQSSVASRRRALWCSRWRGARRESGVSDACGAGRQAARKRLGKDRARAETIFSSGALMSFSVRSTALMMVAGTPPTHRQNELSERDSAATSSRGAAAAFHGAKHECLTALQQ